MGGHNKSLVPRKKLELTDADEALLEAEPDWARMRQAAKWLLSPRPGTHESGSTPEAERKLLTRQQRLTDS